MTARRGRLFETFLGGVQLRDQITGNADTGHIGDQPELRRGGDGDHLGQDVDLIDRANTMQGLHPLGELFDRVNRLGDDDLGAGQRFLQGAQAVRVGVGVGMSGGGDPKIIRQGPFKEHFPRQLAHTDGVEREPGRTGRRAGLPGTDRQIAGEQKGIADAEFRKMKEPTANLVGLAPAGDDVGH